MTELPAVPMGMMTLLSFFAPFLIAIVNRPEWPSKAKYAVTIIANIVLVVAVIVVYYFWSGEPVPEWPVLLLIGLGVTQASYAIVWKRPATTLESKINVS